MVRLAESGRIRGSVLDAGCGTGEVALHLARLGHDVVGFDFAPTAIALATRKAAQAGLADRVRFVVADALRLAERDDLGHFETVLDVGLFHTLQPGDRRAYAAALHEVIDARGSLLLLAWSDRNPFGYGPERVRRRDIRSAFAGTWWIESIGEETLETRLAGSRVHAWLAELRPR